MFLQRPPIPASVAQQFQNNQVMQQRMTGPRGPLAEVNYEVLQRFPGTYNLFFIQNKLQDCKFII